MVKKSFLNFLLLLVVTFSYANALKQDEIQQEMTKRIDNVLSILEKKDKSFTQKGEDIIKIIDDVFDYELMAKIALGKETWGTLTPEKHKHIVTGKQI